MKNRVYKICGVKIVKGKEVYVSFFAEGVWKRTYEMGKETRGHNDGLLFCVRTIKQLKGWYTSDCVMFACDAVGVVDDYKKYGYYIRSRPHNNNLWREFWRLYRKGFKEASASDSYAVETIWDYHDVVFAEAVTPVKMITLTGREVKQ